MIHTAWTFLTVNGVGQNITASILMATPAAVLARWKVLPALRRHLRQVEELHAHHKQHSPAPTDG